MIQRLAQNFPEEPEEFVEEYRKWLNSRFKVGNIREDEELWNKFFRKRTAHEMINDAFENKEEQFGLTGCTDDAVVFITLARARGIPAKYIEAVKKDSEDGSDGHVFAEIYDGEKWVVIDPSSRPHQRGWDFEDYDVIGVGLDYDELGFNSVEEIKERVKKVREVE